MQLQVAIILSALVDVEFSPENREPKLLINSTLIYKHIAVSFHLVLVWPKIKMIKANDQVTFIQSFIKISNDLFFIFHREVIIMVVYINSHTEILHARNSCLINYILSLIILICFKTITSWLSLLSESTFIRGFHGQGVFLSTLLKLEGRLKGSLIFSLSNSFSHCSCQRRIDDNVLIASRLIKASCFNLNHVQYCCSLVNFLPCLLHKTLRVGIFLFFSH